MATILLVGADLALLEGIAQSLAAIGHQAQLAGTVSEAAELAAGAPPLMAVIQRDLAVENPDALRIPLAAGGTFVLFRSADAAPSPLGAGLQRAVIADLTLPLERHRLVALVHHVSERVRRSGRTPSRAPSEEQTPDRHGP